ncbi:MAG: non-canonical purine NTP pyrophosphatase [Candidatus Roizmanbacteria bacterium]|nr:MAG: non-canonical purine NTP pyrophosphatase [Candidatus Roizmanbacteria bacterium]
MNTLLIATHNPSKLKEISNYCKDRSRPVPTIHIELLSLFDLNITSQPEETGKTFEENSLLKAKYYARLCTDSTMCCPYILADDGGLTIDILNGEPGVKSNRWLGHEAKDQELIDFTLKKLQGIPEEKRTAYLETVITFYDPASRTSVSETEKIKGRIADKPSNKWTPGYPYRGLFIVEKFQKYYDDLNEKEHEQVNHRLLALKRLIVKINNYLIE